MEVEHDGQRTGWLIAMLAALVLSPISLMIAYLVLYLVHKLPFS
jgi:hypothetical protein